MITTKTTLGISKVLGYIHATLMLMMITPLLYGIGEVELENSTFVVVLKCLLILIPVIITKWAKDLSPNLGIYLLIFIATTVLIYEATYLPFRPLSAYDFCYMITIVIETLLLFVARLIDRLKKVEGIFDRPNITNSCYFVAMYIIGILFNSKLLCDISFWVTIIYMIIAFSYEYLIGTKHYLYLNNRIKGIPKKRLYGISTAMVLIFFMLCLVGILPSVFMSGYRKYTDIRHLLDDLPPVEVGMGDGGSLDSGMGIDNSLLQMMWQDEEPREPSKLLNAFLWAIGIMCLMIALYGIIQTVRQIFKDFRNAFDENGDIIEEIKDDEAMYKENELHIKGKHIDSEAMRIRRRYKKTIKKHRKDLPAKYEAPNEIEEKAGLGNDEEMIKLHKQYENARYGRV